MKKHDKPAKLNKFNPKDLEHVTSFDNITGERNALFAIGEKRLFLAHVSDGPFRESGPHEDLREVTLKQALQWYVKWENYNWRDSSGEVSLLCKLAAKQLK